MPRCHDFVHRSRTRARDVAALGPLATVLRVATRGLLAAAQQVPGDAQASPEHVRDSGLASRNCFAQRACATWGELASAATDGGETGKADVVLPSMDSVEIDLAVAARPFGGLVLVVGPPTLDPFANLPAEADLWIRWEAAGEEHPSPPRLQIVKRFQPYKVGKTKAHTIAHSRPLLDYREVVLELLATQMVVDVHVTEMPTSNDRTHNDVLSFSAFVEPPTYDWDKQQALCEQFQDELRGKGPARASRRK